MGLLQNFRMLNSEPIFHSAGGTTGSVPSGTCVDRAMFNRPEQYINMWCGEGFPDEKGGVPYGYCPPYQWEMPIKDGGMSSFVGVSGDGKVSLSSNLRMGINLVASVSGSGTVIPFLSALAEIAATLSGQGRISRAEAMCPL